MYENFIYRRCCRFPGRDMVKEYVPKLKAKHKPHFTIINGENAAHGKD